MVSFYVVDNYLRCSYSFDVFIMVHQKIIDENVIDGFILYRYLSNLTCIRFFNSSLFLMQMLQGQQEGQVLQVTQESVPLFLIQVLQGQQQEG
jgi:hypothetical protein